jgi:soluble cytochrome b562
MLKYLLLISTVIFLGCSTKEKSSDTNVVKEHMIDSHKLRLLMREMNLIVYDRDKSELQRDDDRVRYALKLSDKVKKISQNVILIDKSELHLNSVNDKKFRHYAKELNISADQIEKIAKNYELEKLPSALKQLDNRCNACHTEFGVIR